MKKSLRLEQLEVRRMLAIVPDGFTETAVVTGLTSPVTMDIDDSGRIFLAFQNGTIRVLENDVMLPTPFAMLAADGSGERGLQGIELDPNYNSNGYVYVYYTAASPSSHNRVSRLTVDPTTGNTMVPGSEVVLLDLPNLSTVNNPIWHMGGAIHFLPDGTLLVQVGDHQDTSKPQDLQHPFGKLLRINVDGTVPTDNPMYDLSDGLTWQDYIWSSGLRNPFSGDVNPRTGQVFINDVGAGSWEEINDASSAGENFGWPRTEGNFDPASHPTFANPFHAYSHGEDCAITGGAFYETAVPQFPVEYQGKYFYSQFCAGRIMAIDPENPADNEAFATQAEFPMNIEIAPGSGALYYVARGAGAGGNPGTGTGQVLKIESDVQIPPSIVQQPQDLLVSNGFDATFEVQATGNQPLSYQWQSQIGNDAFADIAGATEKTLTISEVDIAQDQMQVRVVVTNAFGAVTSDVAVLSVTLDQPPVATILSPTAVRYTGGQTFEFAGMAVDAEDGVLDAAAMTWQIDFHHDDHLHPFFPETSGVSSGQFTVLSTGETSPNVWYRIRFTVQDSAGLSTTTYHDIYPELSTFTVSSNFGDGAVRLDGAPQEAFQTVTGVVGVNRTIQARQSIADGLRLHPFVEWLDGTQDLNRSFATPSQHQTFAALYADARSSHALASDLPFTNPSGKPVRLDRSISGFPLEINGVRYHRGIGVTSDTILHFDLDGTYTRFRSDIGLDDAVGLGGSAAFRVLGDGAVLYNSGTMVGASTTQSIDVDISGVDRLELEVIDTGTPGDDFANWANARFTRNLAVDDLRVNFQLAGADIPADYVPDYGEVFADRGNGLSYGWTSDHTDLARERSANIDQRLDTLVHFHAGQSWEIELPNGLYNVNVSLGDAGFTSEHTLRVEGNSYWSNEATAANEFRVQSQLVQVSDGRLTLDMGAAPEKATRINFIEISRDVGQLTLFDYRDGDINLDGHVDDQADLVAFLAAYRTDTTGMNAMQKVRSGDFNFDGETNLEDWSIYRAAYLRGQQDDGLLSPKIKGAMAAGASASLTDPGTGLSRMSLIDQVFEFSETEEEISLSDVPATRFITYAFRQ